VEQGDVVKVKAYGGEILTRRVVADLGKTVVICSEAEFQRSKKQKREPSGIGFPRDDVTTKKRD
jgi:hypothetical protein